MAVYGFLAPHLLPPLHGSQVHDHSTRVPWVATAEIPTRTSWDQRQEVRSWAGLSQFQHQGISLQNHRQTRALEFQIIPDLQVICSFRVYHSLCQVSCSAAVRSAMWRKRVAGTKMHKTQRNTQSPPLRKQ